MALSSFWKGHRQGAVAVIATIRQVHELLAVLFFKQRVRSEVLQEPTRALLEQFRNDDLPDRAYLAGGTAIALRLGHRQSADLDWFTPQKFDEKVWQMRWEFRWNFELRGRDWQTLTGAIRGVKTALYYYNYPLIEEVGTYRNVIVAGLKDLAAMKMDAVLSRGTKRDFIDLYFLSKRFGIRQMFALYDQKYGNLADRELMLRKALVYFKEADRDEMPRMLADIEWLEIKEYFLKALANCSV